MAVPRAVGMTGNHDDDATAAVKHGDEFVVTGQGSQARKVLSPPGTHLSRHLGSSAVVVGVVVVIAVVVVVARVVVVVVVVVIIVIAF